MLKQLLKYEFKATGRTYGGLYLALVALAVLSGFSLRSSSKDNFASLLLFAYMVVAVAVAVVSVMTIVTRFTRNLLGREGYLMHTLPVTESQLILSKLISSVVWMLCSSIVGIFSFAVMLLALSLNSAALQQLPELWQKVVEIFREIFRMTGSSGWLWLAFETLNGLVALVSSILCIYAACMIGHQFKSTWSRPVFWHFPAVLPAELAELRCQQCRHAAGCFRSHPWRCRCFHRCAQCVHHPVRAGGQHCLCRRILSADPLADGA